MVQRRASLYIGWYLQFVGGWIWTKRPIEKDCCARLYHFSYVYFAEIALGRFPPSHVFFFTQRWSERCDRVMVAGQTVDTPESYGLRSIGVGTTYLLAYAMQVVFWYCALEIHDPAVFDSLRNRCPVSP